ncbi:unnamed protein product [Ambrosiozyma monospora]|uniref:Unnamed protein product n=1 Tax=Ambrosiozyma monospora TaxID=43982 RepID=A0ACB5SSH4_AMBMO|nr:unnamed protein product [Ambrosiozyma monospora]
MPDRLFQPIDWRKAILAIYFYRYEDAYKFLKFSITGMLKVNGGLISATWISQQCQDELDSCYARYDSQEQVTTFDLMLPPENARRLLVFKKPIQSKIKRREEEDRKKREEQENKLNKPNEKNEINQMETDNKRVDTNKKGSLGEKNGNNKDGKKENTTDKKGPKFPDPLLNYSKEFNLDEVRRDMEQFGPIVEILPVISRQLSFGVHFLDVKSAYLAKHCFDPKSHDIDSVLDGSMYTLRNKYKDWFVFYTRDPADKPLLVP